MENCSSIEERQLLRLEFNEKVAAIIDAFQCKYYDENFTWPELNIRIIRTVLRKGIPEKIAAPLIKAEELKKKYPSVNLRRKSAASGSISQGECVEN